jgi:beta-lactam-binding protein with PASTA domain
VTVRTGLRGFLPYAVAIIGGFLIAYLIVAFFVFPSGVIPGEARVPNVAGLLFDDAAKRLAEVGFKAQRGETRFHGGAPKETVLEQEPRAGSRNPEGTMVTLVVSAGQQIASVPGVVGMSQSEAQAALETAGFEVGQVLERPSNDPRGQVIESKPAPGAKVAIPTAVMLILSAGSSVTVVPNVVGRTIGEARELLQNARLAVGSVNAPSGSSTDAGTVVSQSPPAGAQVAANSRVALQIGNRR